MSGGAGSDRGMVADFTDMPVPFRSRRVTGVRPLPVEPVLDAADLCSKAFAWGVIVGAVVAFGGLILGFVIGGVL